MELPPGRLKRSRHGVYFCSRVCKDNGQRIGGIEKIQPPHYGTRQIAEYRKMFSPDELKCIRCGYNEFGCAVEIHHKDGDRKNNNRENLVTLCANCHGALHHKKWKLT